MVEIADRTVLITGANRGIGRALVREALARGVGRVYAGTRVPLTHDDPRVTPVDLDVTDAARVRAAAAGIDALDILINNAGIALGEEMTEESLERHLAVNLFGTYRVTQAFVPALTRSPAAAVVNNLSINSLAALPLLPAYSVSKAAAFSLTQSLRAALADAGVRVHAVVTGPVDTDLTRSLAIPKAAPDAVAKAVFDGIERDEDEIFPDPFSAALAESWRAGAIKDLERRLAGLSQALAAP